MGTKKKKKVVVIGGGTGTVAVLMGCKQYKDVDLSVIVSMTDDGGSNKVVRDEFGLLPLSDLRKSIIALSDTGNGMLRKLFTYRFDKGEGLKTHTMGNLMMMGLSDITGSEVDAIAAASKLFNVKGKVIPVTLGMTQLVAEYDDGRKIKGEHLIDEPDVESDAKIKKFYVSPSVKPNPEAVKAIKQADYIVAGPGDLYTSTIANIIIEGIPEALQSSKAKYIFITNLMTKKGQTHWMQASDMVNEITKYSGRQPDFVLVNDGKIYPSTIRKYARKSEYMIKDDISEDVDYEVIRTDIVSNDEVEEEKGDILERALVRHDFEEVGEVLYNLFINN